MQVSPGWQNVTSWHFCLLKGYRIAIYTISSNQVKQRFLFYKRRWLYKQTFCIHCNLKPTVLARAEKITTQINFFFSQLSPPLLTSQPWLMKFHTTGLGVTYDWSTITSVCKIHLANNDEQYLAVLTRCDTALTHSGGSTICRLAANGVPSHANWELAYH